jgi:predicted kinase
LRSRLDGARLTSLFVRCDVPLEVATVRATRRLGDAERVSDATPAIVAEQFRSFEPLRDVPRESVWVLNTPRPLGEQVAQMAYAVDRRLSGAGARTLAAKRAQTGAGSARESRGG